MSADFAAERAIMVDSQVRPQDVTDLALQDAMRTVPRELYVPADKAWAAYADCEVEYAPGRWMLRPRDVAKLLHGLRAKAGERALAIASPYAAAVLTAMGLDVTRLDEGDLKTVSGKWQVIVCEGGVMEVPPGWRDAIAPGGRLAVIERRGHTGQAMLYSRAESGLLGERALFDCAAPVMGGFEVEPGFVF